MKMKIAITDAINNNTNMIRDHIRSNGSVRRLLPVPPAEIKFQHLDNLQDEDAWRGFH